MHNLKTTGSIYGHSTCQTTFYYQRHPFCGLELYERSNWKATAPDMHCGRSLIQHYRCACCKPVHTSLIGLKLRMKTKLTFMTIASFPGLPLFVLHFAFNMIHGSNVAAKSGKGLKATIMWMTSGTVQLRTGCDRSGQDRANVRVCVCVCVHACAHACVIGCVT